MTDTLAQYLGALPTFAAYFALSIGLMLLFLAIYVRTTPHKEVALIRDGNAAAALSLAGAMLGYVLPLASVVTNSLDLKDLALWGIVAMVVQLIAYQLARFVVPNLSGDIAAGRIAAGIWVGTLALASGILNAACMIV